MALGIDVGGTKILAVKIENGEIKKKWIFKTENGEVIKTLMGVIEESGESVVGIGVPCYLRNGICVKAPNIPELTGQNLRNYFKKVIIMNDCTAMAYGEYALRDEKYDPLLLVALGTGVGAGLVFKGIPYVGRGSALEIGHLKGFSEKPCQCGKRGCLETVLGGGYVDVKGMYDMAKGGDERAVKFFEDYGKTLARGLSYAIQLLDPEIVVIGGGISNAYNFFIDPMKKELEELLSFIDVDDILFEKAKSEESAALGAAYIAERKLI